MITINTFKITTDGTALDVSVSAEATFTITSAVLWTQATFKDYAQAVDFTSKLTQTSENEVFQISAAELNVAQLDGIYWMEFDTDEPDTAVELAVTTNLTRFYYCITEMICQVVDPCVANNLPLFNSLTANLYIDSLRNALILGQYQPAIMFWTNLNRLCKVSCKTCCDISPITQAGLGFATINNQLVLQ